MALDANTDALSACITSPSGEAPQHVQTRASGSFSVRDDGRTATGTSLRGPLLMAMGAADARVAAMDRLVHVVEKTDPGLASSPHETLRSALRSTEPTLVVVGTLVMTPKLQQDIEALVLANLGIGKAALGVRKLGASVHVVGDSVELTGIVECGDPESCSAIRDQLMRLRMSLSSKPGLRLAGISPLLDNLSAEASGPRVTARTKDTQENVAALLKRAGDLL
jgi:hypothetical protein